MQMENQMYVRFPSLSVNEGFARVVVGAFAAQLNPTLEELADIKTAVSEAVTNAIVHGYEGMVGSVEIQAFIKERLLTIEISDKGKGIEDVEQARQPFFTTAPGMERSGMGFTVMETFMDSLEVESHPSEGTAVKMSKTIGAVPDSGSESQ
jgi:stage II sporulation protein AB (anti-sigma F factor)